MIYGTFRVRWTEEDKRMEKTFSSLNEAENFWELCDDPTSAIFDEYYAFVEYEDILRAV